MPQARKRILHIIQSLNNGGCENMLLRTLPLLKSTENEVLVLSKPGDLADSFVRVGIRVHVLSQKSLIDAAAYVRLFKKIKMISPDIIITYLLHADIVGRMFIQVISNVPVIPFLRTNYNHPRYRLARCFERLTKAFVKRYLANSEAVKKYYVDTYLIKPEKITVIPNGIDVEKFNKKNFEKEIIRNKFEIPADRMVIVCVANFSINKGHKYLLNAFERVYEGNKNILLLLVGDGVEKDNLLKHVGSFKSREAIWFLGKRRNVDEILAISEIFVLPTLFEGMSNALMEAMASGLSVIATDIPENAILVSNGHNGLLVPTKDSSKISESLEILLKNDYLRKKTQREARDFIVNKMSLLCTLNKWDNFLNEKHG